MLAALNAIRPPSLVRFLAIVSPCQWVTEYRIHAFSQILLIKSNPEVDRSLQRIIQRKKKRDTRFISTLKRLNHSFERQNMTETRDVAAMSYHQYQMPIDHVSSFGDFLGLRQKTKKASSLGWKKVL